MSGRQQRKEEVLRASELQTQAGLQSCIRFTSVGIGATILAHYISPTIRRQTLAMKGYFVIGCATVGLVFGAEKALLEYEAKRSVEENLIRRQARLELGRQGIVPTESEIARWKSENEMK